MIRFQSINHRPSRLAPLLRRAVMVVFLLPAAASMAQTLPEETHIAPHIEVSLVSEVETIEPGTPFQVAIRLLPDEGWHTYWRNPGDTGLPTRIDWALPAGGDAGSIQWPYPERIDYQGLINYGYHGETLLLTTVTPPQDIKPGESYPLRADVHWLICKDVCIPGSSSVAASLTIDDTATPGPWSDRFTATRARLTNTSDIATGRFYLDEKLVVALPDAAGLIKPGDNVQFFPIDPDLVLNTVEPRVRHHDGRVLIRTTRDPDFTGPIPETFNGLLVVDKGQNTQAYEFSTRASATPITFPASENRTGNTGMLYILLLAFAGGIILNLMPCVFPVLSIKILSLIKSGTHSAAKRQLHGLAYTGGILASMLIFAGVLLGVRAAGETVGWGFQLQSPLFVSILIYIFFIMGLSLSGLLDIGISLTRSGNLLDRFSGPAGSFFNGALATVVATPCTVPFMATAVGFALTQSVPSALAVFTVLGLGLASPFLLLALVPALADKLPKPGVWMETLKQFLAFPLYFTVIWLIWVLDRLTGSDIPALVLTGLVLIVMALWLWRQGSRSHRPAVLRGLALITALASLALLPGIITRADLQDRPVTRDVEYAYPVVDYSENRVRDALANNRPVFVNINADWCITCKVNERIALNDGRVQNAFRDRNVLYMVGDWTDGNARLSRVLTRFGRSGVPLYLVYLPGQAKPRILPQLLTPTTVISALEG